jgi:hypothetical protein
MYLTACEPAAKRTVVSLSLEVKTDSIHEANRLFTVFLYFRHRQGNSVRSQFNMVAMRISQSIPKSAAGTGEAITFLNLRMI